MVGGCIGAAGKQIVIFLRRAVKQSIFDGASPESKAGQSLFENPLGIAKGQLVRQQPGQNHPVGTAAPNHHVRLLNQLPAFFPLGRVVRLQHIGRNVSRSPPHIFPLLLHFHGLNEKEGVSRHLIQCLTEIALVMIKVIRCKNNGRSTHPFRKLHISYYYTRKVSYFNNMIWRSAAFPVTLRTLYQYIGSLIRPVTAHRGNQGILAALR